MRGWWQPWAGKVWLVLVGLLVFGGYQGWTAQGANAAIAPSVANAFNPNTPTIIGGREAEPGSWPWMVALVYSSSADARLGQFCGGALIHRQWVLTAAHCTYDIAGRLRQPTEIEIVLGRHRLSSDEGQRVPVVAIIPHPDYEASTFNNDLALLRLAHTVAYPPLALPQADRERQEAAGTLVTITGWGVTDEGRDSDALRQVEVPLVDRKTCRRSYGIFSNKVTDNMLCAGLRAGGRDSCQGDSGGPMMLFNEPSGTWQQLGIVSWGEGCAKPDYYGVYTRVSNYLTWITTQIPTLDRPNLSPTPTPSPTPSQTPLPTSTQTATPTTGASTPTSTFVPTAPASVTPTPTLISTRPPTSPPTPTLMPPTNAPLRLIYLPHIAMNQVQFLRNGDFEAGLNGWNEYSLQRQPLVVHAMSDVAAYNGSFLARLGGIRNEVAFVEQQVTIRPAAPVLQLWLQIVSNDDCGYDFAGVVVNDAIADQFDLCRATATSGWQLHQVDLSAYRDRTVSLEVRAEIDGFLDSVLYVDNVSFGAPVQAAAGMVAFGPPTRGVTRRGADGQ